MMVEQESLISKKRKEEIGTIIQREEPTRNPKLRFAMIDFVEEMGLLRKCPGKENIILQKENTMKSEIEQAQFIMPVQLYWV